MCRLRNTAMRDYQESGTTRQTHAQTDRQTDAGQSNPYVPLCFAGDTKMYTYNQTHRYEKEETRTDIGICKYFTQY